MAMSLPTHPWKMESAEVPFLDDRDFLYWEVTQTLPGGIHIIFGQSLTAEEEAACSDAVPHSKGVIRGRMGASGGYPLPLMKDSPPVHYQAVICPPSALTCLCKG